MSSISGRLFFNPTRVTVNTGATISGVPIILQDTNSNIGKVVLSDLNGNYRFNNVPNGSYRVVEGWGTSGGVTSPGDFLTASVIPQPTPKDPPVSQVVSPPATTNIITSMTPNTLFVTVTGPDITTLNFNDGPTNNTPLPLNGVSVIGSNLVTACDNGTWGALPVGTPSNTAPATAPYPGNVPGFNYQQYPNGPFAGAYSVVNTTTTDPSAGNWWHMADHTTGDETGRYEVMNGLVVGALFFLETIPVSPNTNYLFSTWIANYARSNIPQPQLTFTISSLSGNVIFTRTTNTIGIPNIPTWKELGSFVNSQNNSQLVISFSSGSPQTSGNDFVIDDISFAEATINQVISVNKTNNRPLTTVGDTITYTISLNNFGSTTISNIILSDTIPIGTSFISNSFSVNGTTIVGANPSPPGVNLNTIIAPRRTLTVTFKVSVTTIPCPNPILNSALINYGFFPIANDVITVPNSILTNETPSLVVEANLSNSVKYVDKSYADCGDILTYTIVMKNSGLLSALNVTFFDTIPNGGIFITNTFKTNGVTVVNGNPSIRPGINIGSILPNSASTLTFNMLIKC